MAILVIILLSGCTNQNVPTTSNAQQVSCPDGSIVSDASKCPVAFQNVYSPTLNSEPYYKDYCDKINPYDLSVRTAEADAIRNHPGAYSVDQLLDIYDWIHANVIYQSVPLAGIPYPPSETLTTKSGDCKNQAVLIASMVEAIGGNSQVVVDPGCAHAYAIVRIANASDDMHSFANTIATHYDQNVYVNWFAFDNANWVIFDPAGGQYPGNTLPECTGNRTRYFVSSCMDCDNQNGKYPYTFGGKCYSQCPSGTVSINNNACETCPQGYYSFNNKCVSCPSGSYLAVDGNCYQKS